jgi:hypothetical protein
MAAGAHDTGNDPSLRGVRRFLWILLVVALILAVWGIVSRVVGRNRIGRDRRGRHSGRHYRQTQRESRHG